MAIHVSPHQLRHSFAVHMLAMLIQHRFRDAAIDPTTPMEGYRRLLGDPLQQVQPTRPCQSRHHLYRPRPYRHARRYGRRRRRGAARPGAERAVATTRPRRGRRVSFDADDGAVPVEPADSITGRHFTITAQNGGDALIDYNRLKPRRLALAVARALRQLGAPGGPLTVRSTVKAYAVTLPRFFAYLAQTRDGIGGPEDLRAHHVDGFRGLAGGRGPAPDRGGLPPKAVIRPVK